MKRGGPSGLRKGEEQELEGKSPIVFFLAMCYLEGDNKLQACCQVLLSFYFIFALCSVVLQRG